MRGNWNGLQSLSLAREFRQIFDGFDMLPLDDKFHARFHWFTVYEDHTLRTLSIRTKQPLRAAVFVVVSKYMDVVGKKSRSYGFTLIRSKLLTFPVEINQVSLLRWKNRVLVDTVVFHFNP